jgi:HlyD family secretion protein
MKLAVREGDVVTRGQILVEIDPTQLQTIVEQREASLASARSQLSQTDVSVENAKVALSQAEDSLRRAEASAQSGLIPREQLERARNEVKTYGANLRSTEQSVLTQKQRVKQEEANLTSAQIDLTKVHVASPINGIVTQRLIEEGETARYNAIGGGTDLLAIADMSGIEAEIEVDETDIPFIKIGQLTKVSIDALPGKEFPGRVNEVGNSPIQAGGATGGRATNFKVKVTIDGTVPDVRPGFTCTAVVTTATRKKVLAVPIQAMTVREKIVDAAGNVVPDTPGPGTSGTTPVATSTALATPKEGQSRKEIEGVFLVRDGKAVFAPVKIGIAGDKYYEVLGGLKEGDEVVTGPPTAARTLKEGDTVTVTAATPAGGTTPAR